MAHTTKYPLRAAVTTLLLLCVLCFTTTFAPVVIMTAETLNLWTNPPPKPNFIRKFEFSTNELHTLNLLWVHLDEFELWEAGDHERDVFWGIMRTTHIEIDGNVQPRHRLWFSSLDMLIPRMDENGNLIGSHGGGVSICTDITELREGSHLVSIRFSTTSGKTYEYRWAFEIVREQGVMSINWPSILDT
jgi:hypothetical protein